MLALAGGGGGVSLSASLAPASPVSSKRLKESTVNPAPLGRPDVRRGGGGGEAVLVERGSIVARVRSKGLEKPAGLEIGTLGAASGRGKVVSNMLELAMGAVSPRAGKRVVGCAGGAANVSASLRLKAGKGFDGYCIEPELGGKR